MMMERVPTQVAKDENNSKPHYIFFHFHSKELFDNLMRYLGDIEQLPYYLIIDHMAWSRPPKEEQRNVVLKFEGHIYSAE